MIAPSGRLIWSATLTTLPLSLAPALLPQATAPLALLLAAAAGLWAIDAWRTRELERSLAVRFPERLDLARGRGGELFFEIEAELPARLELGLDLPEEMTSSQRETRLALNADAPAATVSWQLTGRRRGRFAIERLFVRFPSPFGFWSRRACLAAGTRVHVYPDMVRERRNLAPLLLRRWEPGRHRRRPVGQGRDFEKLRDYLPGDSLGDIHWKATAKRGHPVTKEFRIERTQEIYLVVDTSRLSARPAGDGADPSEPLLERFLPAALAMGMVARREGDLFGLITFDDRVRTFLRAGSGQAHFNACREALFDLEPRAVSPDFEELAAFLNLRLRRRSLLLFLTSLDDPALADDFARSMPVVARRHLVLAAMPRPHAARPLFSGAPPEATVEIYRSLGGHLLWQDLRELEKNLRLSGIHLHLLDAARLAAEMAERYLDVKRRQLL